MPLRQVVPSGRPFLKAPIASSYKTGVHSNMVGQGAILPDHKSMALEQKKCVFEAEKSLRGKKETDGADRKFVGNTKASVVDLTSIPSAVKPQVAFWVHVKAVLTRCKVRTEVHVAGATGYCTSLSAAKYRDAINILCAEEAIPDLAIEFINTGHWYPCPMEDSSKMEDDDKTYGIYRGPHIIIEQRAPYFMSYRHIFFHPIDTFEEKMKVDLGQGKEAV
jgi:hypothetical protein